MQLEVSFSESHPNMELHTVCYLHHHWTDCMERFHMRSTESVGFLHVVINFLLGQKVDANVGFIFTMIVIFTLLLIFHFLLFLVSLIKISRGMELQ